LALGEQARMRMMAAAARNMSHPLSGTTLGKQSVSLLLPARGEKVDEGAFPRV
jgi:hypothetical protein